MYDTGVNDHSDAGVGFSAMTQETCRQQQKVAVHAKNSTKVQTQTESKSRTR